MSESIRDPLPESHPEPTEEVTAALDAIYNWNYEPELDQLRTLYANALERQWIGLRDLDWDAEIDREGFTSGFSLGGFPVTRTKFWARLAPDTRWEVARLRSEIPERRRAECRRHDAAQRARGAILPRIGWRTTPNPQSPQRFGSPADRPLESF